MINQKKQTKKTTLNISLGDLFTLQISKIHDQKTSMTFFHFFLSE